MIRLLAGIARLERILTIAAFAVMALALMADVLSRRFFQVGLIGATEVAVIGMIGVAMFGIGIATDDGAHLRPRFFDFLVPKALAPAIERVAAALTAVFFFLFAGLSVFMVLQSASLGDRTEILRLPIWILQLMLVLGFLTNALRFTIYALRPELKPSDDPARVAELVEDEPSETPVRRAEGA